MVQRQFDCTRRVLGSERVAELQHAAEQGRLCSRRGRRGSRFVSDCCRLHLDFCQLDAIWAGTAHRDNPHTAPHDQFREGQAGAIGARPTRRTASPPWSPVTNAFCQARVTRWTTRGGPTRRQSCHSIAAARGVHFLQLMLHLGAMCSMCMRIGQSLWHNKQHWRRPTSAKVVIISRWR